MAPKITKEIQLQDGAAVQRDSSKVQYALCLLGHFIRHFRRGLLVLLRCGNRLGKWLFTEQKILGNLVTATGTIGAALIVFNGFQKLQLSLDATAKIAAEIEKLADADAHKRNAAVPALVRYAERDTETVVTNIMILLDDEDPATTKVCYRVLENIKDRQKVVGFLTHELETNKNHSSGVPDALLELAQPNTLSKIFDSIRASFEQDQRRESKGACALALGKLHDNRALDPLAGCIKKTNNDSTIRSKCITGLGILFPFLNAADAKKVAGTISEYVYDRDVGVEAISALCQPGKLNDVLDSDGKRRVSGAIATSLRQATDQVPFDKCAEALSLIANPDDQDDLLRALSTASLPETAFIKVLDVLFMLRDPAVKPKVKAALKRVHLSPRERMRLQYWEQRTQG